jgi:multidrug efflux pump
MTKNGILIVEFTNQLREQGVELYEAVVKASEMRLRPILMTSIATVFGAVPLALSSGAGAEARATIGWVIIGGASLSTFMTLFLVPSVFLMVGNYTSPRSTIAEKLAELQERFASGDKDRDKHGHGHRPGAQAGQGLPAE